MKKVLAALMLMLMIILPGRVMYAKDLKVAENYSISIPDLAPEFISWQGGIVAVEEVTKQILFAVALLMQPDGLAQVSILMVKMPDRVHIVGVGIEYTVRPGQVEYIEDKQFRETGVPSGKLEYVPAHMDLDALRSFFKKANI